jgi:hypothetical protein
MQKTILGFSDLKAQRPRRHSALSHQGRLNAGYGIQEMIL